MKSSPKHRHNSPIHCAVSGSSNLCSSKSMRKEVWIYPDGIRRLHRSDLTSNKQYFKEDHILTDLPVDEVSTELNKYFLVDFIFLYQFKKFVYKNLHCNITFILI